MTLNLLVVLSSLTKADAQLSPVLISSQTLMLVYLLSRAHQTYKLPLGQTPLEKIPIVMISMASVCQVPKLCHALIKDFLAQRMLELGLILFFFKPGFHTLIHAEQLHCPAQGALASPRKGAEWDCKAAGTWSSEERSLCHPSIYPTCTV